jgi:hypothetical protein
MCERIYIFRTRSTTLTGNEKLYCEQDLYVYVRFLPVCKIAFWSKKENKDFSS